MDSDHQFSRTLCKFSLGLDFFSFVFPDFGEVMSFVFGLMAIPLYPIWLANPFYWYAATNVIQERSRRQAVVASKFACGFALLPIVMDAMERENTAELIPAGNPYWRWAGSMILMLIASVVQCSVESPSQV